MPRTAPSSRWTEVARQRFRREQLSRKRRRKSDWALVVSFWVFSLLFGIGAAITGWGLAMIVAWVMLAVAAVSAMTHTSNGDERLFH